MDNETYHYQLTESGVKRLEDNAFIPDAEGNRDWQEYQLWLEEGNEPEPIPPPDPQDEYNEMIRQRNQLLDDNDWTILRHKDQLELGTATTLSDESYQSTLTWRQQLRDMPDILSSETTETPAWTWPPIPPELKEDFPDYPPKN